MEQELPVFRLDSVPESAWKASQTTVAAPVTGATAAPSVHIHDLEARGTGIEVCPGRVLAARFHTNTVELCETGLDSDLAADVEHEFVHRLRFHAPILSASLFHGETHGQFHLIWFCAITVDAAIHRVALRFVRSDYSIFSKRSQHSVHLQSHRLTASSPVLAADWLDIQTCAIGTAAGAVITARFGGEDTLPFTDKEITETSGFSKMFSALTSSPRLEEGVIAIALLPGSPVTEHRPFCVSLHRSSRIRVWNMASGACCFSHLLADVSAAGAAGLLGDASTSETPKESPLLFERATMQALPSHTAGGQATVLLQVLTPESATGPTLRLTLSAQSPTSARLALASPSSRDHFFYPHCPAPSVGAEMVNIIGSRTLLDPSAGGWTAWRGSHPDKLLGVVVRHGPELHPFAESKSDDTSSPSAVIPLWAHRVQHRDIDLAGAQGSAEFVATDMADVEVFYLSRVFYPNRFPFSVIESALSSYRAGQRVEAWGADGDGNSEERLKALVVSAVRDRCSSILGHRTPSERLTDQRDMWLEFLNTAEQMWHLSHALLAVVPLSGDSCAVLRAGGLSVLRRVDVAEGSFLHSLSSMPARPTAATATAATTPADLFPPGPSVHVAVATWAASAIAGILPARVVSRLDSLSRNPQELSTELISVARELNSHVLDWVSELEEEFGTPQPASLVTEWTTRDVIGLTGPFSGAYARGGPLCLPCDDMVPRLEPSRGAFARRVLQLVRSRLGSLISSSSTDTNTTLCGALTSALDSLDPASLGSLGGGSDGDHDLDVDGPSSTPVAPHRHHRDGAATVASCCELAASRRAACRDIGLLVAVLSESDLLSRSAGSDPTSGLSTKLHSPSSGAILTRAALLSARFRAIEWSARLRYEQQTSLSIGAAAFNVSLPPVSSGSVSGSGSGSSASGMALDSVSLGPPPSSATAPWMPAHGDPILNALYSSTALSSEPTTAVTNPASRLRAAQTLLAALTYEPSPAPTPSTTARRAPTTLLPPVQTAIAEARLPCELPSVSLLAQFLVAAAQYPLLRQYAANRASWYVEDPTDRFSTTQRQQYTACVAVCEVMEAKRLGSVGDQAGSSAVLTSAVKHFHQAAPVVGTRDAASGTVSSGPDALRACLDYHHSVARLLGRAGFDAHSVGSIEAGLSCADALGSPTDATFLWARLFNVSVEVNDFERAFLAARSNPLEERRIDGLRRLVLVMCERRRLRQLCALPLSPSEIRLTAEVILWKAWTSDVNTHLESSSPSAITYYHLLYAFLTRKRRHRLAAAASWALALRLSSCPAPPSLAAATEHLRQRVRAVSAACTSLSLAPPEQRFLRRREWWPGDLRDTNGEALGWSRPEAVVNGGDRRRRTDGPEAVGLLDLRRELALLSGRLEVAETSSETLVDTQAALVASGRFERAISVGQACRDGGYAYGRATTVTDGLAGVSSGDGDNASGKQEEGEEDDGMGLEESSDSGAAAATSRLVGPAPAFLPAVTTAPKAMGDVELVRQLARTFARLHGGADDTRTLQLGLDDDDDPVDSASPSPRNVVPSSGEASALPMAGGVAGMLGGGGAGTGLSVQQRCERLLADYLRRYDGPLTGFSLHQAALDALSSESPVLVPPPWLMRPLLRDH